MNIGFHPAGRLHLKASDANHRRAGARRALACPHRCSRLRSAGVDLPRGQSDGRGQRRRRPHKVSIGSRQGAAASSRVFTPTVLVSERRDVAERL